jgi:hypothetical protein
MRSAAFGNTSSIGVTFGLSVRIVRSTRARCNRRQATYKRVHVPDNHATNCVARHARRSVKQRAVHNMRHATHSMQHSSHTQCTR